MTVPPDAGSSSPSEARRDPQPGTDESADADVRAFLIADVRGYTSFTQEHGDEGAARLAARFAEVTRALVENYRGRVVELRGDEALVVFGSPRSAIRAAVAMQERFVEESIADPALPLTVGIGLDAGEAVPVEGGYRGGALNVAGRLQARARAGEVLASREIVHLARRIDGIRFIERGQVELKGIDQPVHVIAVRSEHHDAAEAMAPFVRSAALAHPRKRWKVAAGAVVLAVLAASIAIPLTRRVGGSSEIDSNSIGILDPESGELVSTLRLEARPGSIAASEHDVWVTHPDVGIVRRVDREERAVVDSYRVGENPTGIAVSEDAVWVVESGGPSVSIISPDTSEVLKTIEVGNGPAGIAVGEGGVWVTNRFDGTLSRIDPNRGQVVKTISVGADPQGVAVGFGSVWVSLAASSMVVRIDPQTNSLMQPIGVGNAPGPLAVSADAVWVANTLDDTISEIDPETNTVVDTVEVGDDPSEMTVVGGAVWVANEADGTLTKIEPGAASGSTETIGSVPQGIAGVGDELWVSVRGLATSHRGGTLRLLGNYTPESVDPSGAYDSASWMMLHLLGDGLVATEPVGGASGALVPDLSTSVPVPTDGGTTYTFELRTGIRYSNGEIVEPIDFRRGIERVFRLEPYAHALFQGLVGGEACHDEPRTCDLSEGIEIDSPAGTTITFNLVDPDPEFLYKLSIPLSYPVPSSVPDEEQVRAGIPGTGPYTLEGPMTDQGLSLVRNPHFRVWSSVAQPDGYADRIEWTFGLSTRDQVEAVAAGDADLTFDVARSARLDDIFVRFPGQVHSNPNPQTIFIVLDTRSPPFNDVDVRRAMNLVIDRDRLVQIFGGEGAMRPTCQQLPQNFPGYQPYCPYTAEPGPGGEGIWAAPGASIDEARAIVRRSGTAGMRVAFEYPPEYWPQGVDMGRYMVDLLEKVGYRGSVRPVSLEAFYDPRNEFQMALAGWTSDYPAASNFINGWLTCDASLTPRSGFCDPRIDEEVAEATKKQIDDPVAALALWAQIDRAIVDRAPYVWIANRSIVNLVSDRVGNYQFSAQWGPLLNQLWVR